MRLSEAGLSLLRDFEGFSERAYPDPGSSNGLPITIGYGSTRDENGRPFRLGDTITRDRADELLRREVAETERQVAAYVSAPITQPQFDALCSFAYNVGVGAFGKSTLLRKLNAGDYASAADEFLRWDKNDGRVMPGLARRRRRERELFLSSGMPVPPTIGVRPEPAPAPTPERKPMAPVLAALLPTLVGMIPELAKLFGSGSAVSERNAKAAERVAQVVVEATQAANLQAAVETMQSNPDARRAASEAVHGAWYELVEAGGGGIDGARKFNVQAAAVPAWRMPAVWVTVALLLPVYAVVGAVLWGEGWSNEIRLQVVTAVLVVISVVSAYWLGSSSGSARKTDIIAGKE